MNRRVRHNGFSLTEVLLATGILTVGFLFVAGTFPVGMKLTANATERTIGSIAADEAVAKIRLYRLDDDSSDWPSDPSDGCVDFANVFVDLDSDEYAYPSTNIEPDSKKYFWSTLCRRTGPQKYQLTVFITRKASAGAKYPYRENLLAPWTTVDYPRPVEVTREVDPSAMPGEFINSIEIDPVDEALAKYITEDTVLVDSATGRLMRVLETEKAVVTDTYRRMIILEDMVEEITLGDSFWVIPPAAIGPNADPTKPPTVGSRYPCIGIYQKPEVDF